MLFGSQFVEVSVHNRLATGQGGLADGHHRGELLMAEEYRKSNKERNQHLSVPHIVCRVSALGQHRTMS